MYVHQRLDADVIPCLFLDLPQPYKGNEFIAREDLSTVEAHQEGVVAAKSKLAQARKGVARKYFGS